MKKTNFFSIALMLILSSSAFAQQIIDGSSFSPTNGGARILQAQGNTPANPAIGFHGMASTTNNPQNDGGGGNGIYRPLANTMAFATTSLERMRITSGGQIGINNSSPLYRFHVTDASSTSFGFDASTSTSGYTTLLKMDDVGLTFGHNSTIRDFKFKTGNSINMTLVPNGNVGIGTSSPAQKLHLLGSQFIDNGNLGIGISAPSNTFSKLQVHNGAIMVSGSNGAGGPMICFSDNIASTAYPNGRWGIEYTSGGLNFWQPWNPSTGGGGNYYMFLKDDGKVGIGVDPAACSGNSFAGSHKLYVNGSILSTGLKVANFCSANWADYVFEDNYNLKSLNEVEKFIIENKHLPNIPSAMEIEKEGLDVAQMQAKQMEKIEELTLYLIEMKKEIDQLKKENENLKNKFLNK